MITVTSLQQLEELKAAPALLLLFGGPHCGVCTIIKPKINDMMLQQFPDIVLAYADCEQSPEVCAQQSVFSLPVVKLFVEGQLSLEMARSFSIRELESGIARIYQLWKGAT